MKRQLPQELEKNFLSSFTALHKTTSPASPLQQLQPHQHQTHQKYSQPQAKSASSNNTPHHT